MSKIGKQIIKVPEGVQVSIENHGVKVTGPKGELFFHIRSAVKVFQVPQGIKVTPQRVDKFGLSLWGTTVAKMKNMIKGATEGYIKKLEFFGVGFRAQVEKSGEFDKIVLNVGYSHPVELVAPKGIALKVEKNIISVEGIDKEQVGEFSAAIKRVKPPEPYKGKGIKYLGEQIRRKVGKAVIKTGEGV